MDGMAVAMVVVMGIVACAAIAVLTWGLSLEARANREQRREV